MPWASPKISKGTGIFGISRGGKSAPFLEDFRERWWCLLLAQDLLLCHHSQHEGQRNSKGMACCEEHTLVY